MAGLLMRLGIVTVFFVALLATVLVRSTQGSGDVTADAEDVRPIITRPVILSTPRMAVLAPDAPAVESSPILAEESNDASRVTLASLPAEATPQAAAANDAAPALLPLVTAAEAATTEATPPVEPAPTADRGLVAETPTPQAETPQAATANPEPLIVAGVAPEAVAPSRAISAGPEPVAEAAPAAATVETVMTPFPPQDPRPRRR